MGCRLTTDCQSAGRFQCDPDLPVTVRDRSDKQPSAGSSASLERIRPKVAALGSRCAAEPVDHGRPWLTRPDPVVAGVGVTSDLIQNGKIIVSARVAADLRIRLPHGSG